MDWTTLRFSTAWAAKRQERLKATFGETIYRDLEAVVLWGLGARAADLQGIRGLGRSSLYEHLTALLDAPPALAGDLADAAPAPAALAVAPAVAGRIVELLVGQRLDAAGIAAQLAAQDGTQVSVMDVQAYLQQAGLADYRDSPLPRPTLPGPPPQPDAAGLTRYAALLWQVPALQTLGLARVLPLLDVTSATTHYSHQLRCQTLLFALAAGKVHVAQVGELVEDEFAAVLGSARYPQRSDLHAYLDRIVAHDQAAAEAGTPVAERPVARFLRESQAAMTQAAGPTAGRELYVDSHVIPLYTEKAVAQTKHGIWQRVVKALVKVCAVSATVLGRVLHVTLGQGDTALGSQLEAVVTQVEQATGQPVEMVGVDRGALSQEVLETFDRRGTGLVVWADDTPTVRQAVAEAPQSAFVDGEYATVRRSDGKVVQRLKTRVADLSAPVINARGYCCRTTVVEDVRTGHRAAFHAVGQPTVDRTATSLLTFLRGKQGVAEEFKQGRAWGADAFCGGEITSELKRARPTAAEVTTLHTQARQLKARWRANLAEEGAAVARWRAGEVTKRALNDLRLGIRRRRQRIVTDWRATEALIRWGRADVVPPSQVRWVVDTRKMSVLGQLQAFSRQARRATLAQLAQCMAEVLVARAVATRGGSVSPEVRSQLIQEAHDTVQRLPWGQVGTRFFAQGGWVAKASEQRVMHVTLKPFGPLLMQQACERLCTHLNAQAPIMHCQDGDYTLHYACQPRPPG